MIGLLEIAHKWSDSCQAWHYILLFSSFDLQRGFMVQTGNSSLSQNYGFNPRKGFISNGAIFSSFFGPYWKKAFDVPLRCKEFWLYLWEKVGTRKIGQRIYSYQTQKSFPPVFISSYPVNSSCAAAIRAFWNAGERASCLDWAFRLCVS